MNELGHLTETELEQHVGVVSLLLATAATSAEYRAIISVALRAELLWRCPECKQANYTTQQFCCLDAGRENLS